MEPKVPPHDIAAEQAVLGSMLYDEMAVYEATEKLSPEDFYREDHRDIFAAMELIFSNSEPIDLITLKNELITQNKLEKVGGMEYLSTLIDTVPTSANVVQYIEIVKEKSELRKIIKAAGEMQNYAFSQAHEPTAIISKVQDIVFNLTKEQAGESYQVLRDILRSTYEEMKEMEKNPGGISGLKTGYTELDRKTRGLQPSNLIILAARPGMGKSALAVNIATEVAVRGGKSALIFNMEMSKNDIAKRILSAEAMIDNNKIAMGKIRGEDREKLVKVTADLGKAELYIDDTPGINIIEIEAKAKKLKMEKDISLIVIDYLQLIEPVGKRNMTREQEITQISRSLKKLAMELQIPIIALSQLSRSAERGGSSKGKEGAAAKRPMLSDLRESGAIEQDADIVLFIYRDEYYNQGTENQNIAELIIAKHRGGTTGTINLYWSGANTKFMNIQQEEDPF